MNYCIKRLPETCIMCIVVQKPFRHYNITKVTESNNKALHNSFYASRSREIQSPVCISVKKRQVLKGKEVRGDAV